MNSFRPSRLILAGLCLSMLAGCGGSPDGDRERPLWPEYDLTGRWIVVEPVDCVTVSGGLPDHQLDQLSGEFENALLRDGPGTRVIQMGNDLLLFSSESDAPAHGTIAGNRVRFTVSERRMMGALNADLHQEVGGTVLHADRMALQDEARLSLQAGGQTTTVRIRCTYHSERAS